VANRYNAPPPMTIDTGKKITATMTTSSGAIVFELFPSEAPKTVNSFVFLARKGYYDGVIFHRIISGFMIQGGDPTGTGTGGPGYSFEDEPVTRDYLAGTLAMANAGPNTNGSQFFIVHERSGLPKNYTIFGQVVDGMDVVNTLGGLPVTMGPSGERSTPVNPPTIDGIEIVEEA
jgi:cyclophilin family peptidyl-prolyl cis-trans isomerase